MPESTGKYTDATDLSTMPLHDSKTKFYIVRHADYVSTNATRYRLTAETSRGNITIPQLGGSLLLHGRDSKFHVADYDVGGINLIYSSAEILTWQKSGPKMTLLLYGGQSETHEFALPIDVGRPSSTDGVKYRQSGEMQIIQWKVGPDRIVLHFDHLVVYLLWRNEAYNYWSLDLLEPEPINLYSSPSRLDGNSTVIVKAGYLLRAAAVEGSTLNLIGDVNATTEIEVVAAPVGCCNSITFNSATLKTGSCKDSRRLSAVVDYKTPPLDLPRLSQLDWRYLDSLPEIQPNYDDSRWKACNLTASNNPRNLTTPTSLYGGDYGYHSGSLIYRGHFVANGKESTVFLHTQGGSAFGHSVWLDSIFLGSFLGNASLADYNHTMAVSKGLQPGRRSVITVVIDHMGLDENFYADANPMKSPRGILDYSVSGHEQSSITWRMTGNFGGENYFDLSRGPLNEGAMFAERQGYHLPGAPVQHWANRSPLLAVDKAGIGFYATTFKLDIPRGYDVPLSIRLNTDSTTDNATNFRVQIFLNGFQFGKYGTCPPTTFILQATGAILGRMSG